MAGVIVQTLCTRWTKQSRGAPASARRNSTPEQVVLDPARALDEGVTWHEVTFDEPEFILREAYRERSLPNDFLRASVSFEPDHVQAVAKTSDVEILRAILFHDLHPSPPDDFSWLCDTFRLVREDEAASARDVRWCSLHLIQNSLTDDSVHSLTPADRQRLSTEFRTALGQLQADLDEYGPDSGDDHAEQLERVIKTLG